MKKMLLPFLFLSIMAILAACGENNSNDTVEKAEDTGASEEAGTGNVIDITATNFEFDKDVYTVQSGEEVKIKLSNKEGMHGIAIEGTDVNINGDGEATFTPEKPGEYTIYCSIPCGAGHADMKSTLVVE
ncbi:cytochrome C oxidase subunit II [Siminovitchia sp. 179-K 8D1 HS]|uniref:cytochrome C oxidase subunit II n=1 Tax=Siminovitchia sp. 179-K 8D1 HS TaxID=3142385 RepID=UPI0039A05C27